MHQQNEILQILEIEYPVDIAEELLKIFYHALGEYRKENWQYFGNEVGQFLECSRRFLQLKLEGNYTPLTQKLNPMNDIELKKWENSSLTKIDEYKLILPRMIFSMTCIRNKRGMIHKNHIDPNKIDARVLLYQMKWVLAEFVRLASQNTFEETARIIDSIIYRETQLIWDGAGTLRVLNNTMRAEDKVICLLYMRDGQSESELRKSIEYVNPTRFRALLMKLHSNRIIEYNSEKCLISPKGSLIAEKLLS